MQFKVLKTVLCLAFAALTAAAWNLHVLGAAHEDGEDCQVCAVAAAPELNADCGSALLARPLNFVLAEAALPGLPAITSSHTIFSTRAPPAA